MTKETRDIYICDECGLEAGNGDDSYAENGDIKVCALCDKDVCEDCRGEHALEHCEWN